MTLLHTIRRAFAEDLNVFQCKPCGFSTTEPVSWTTPPRPAKNGERSAPLRERFAAAKHR
jgi:hypothetical protein